ncbi:unnamed protein product [Mytilus coruscus]|uniref:PHD-type domain-containing protein n=1 Tax=Mytilus coruscus TaxID=42192 RepID=A0A6J8BRV2_MYTCO|nr:unnamed protein product [Mytilus coruscus]
MANSSTSNEVGNRQSLSLRRSQRSNTNLRRSDPTPNHVDNKIPSFQKDYQLNVNKAISKKLSVVKERVKDKKGHEIEIRLKVSAQKHDHAKAYQKYTINLYHSQSSALVNGPKADLFMETILPQIENYLSQNEDTICDMNNKITQVISHSNVVRNQTHDHDSDQTHTKGASFIDSPCHPITSKSDLDQEQEYLCPVCNGKADKDTKECESCDHWFHYRCVGLTKGKVNKIDPNVPYICNGCNENELYNDDRTSHLNLGILPPLAKAHENQPSGSSIKTSTTEVSKPNSSTMRKSNPILSNHSNQAESVNDQMSTKE